MGKSLLLNIMEKSEIRCNNYTKQCLPDWQRRALISPSNGLSKNFPLFTGEKRRHMLHLDGIPKTNAVGASFVLLLISSLSFVSFFLHKMNLPVSGRENRPNISSSWTYFVLSKSHSKAGWDVGRPQCCGHPHPALHMELLILLITRSAGTETTWL